MPEHFTRNTLECTAWCNVCQSWTQHRVDGGRRGPCLNSHAKVNEPGESKKQEAARIAREKQQQNPSLF